MPPLQNRELLPKHQVLQEQTLLAAKEANERAGPKRKQGEHGLGYIKMLAAELSLSY